MKLIAGMHRSGSSLVAQLCYRLGADLGDPATFYPPDKWNPGGYYEQRDIQEININLINGMWGRLAYLRLPAVQTILRRSTRLAEAIKRADVKYRDRIIKENRFCITLPAWRGHHARIDKLLVCLRDPQAVARSLWRRNKIPAHMAYSLWMEHYRRLDLYRSDIETAYIYYNNLLDANRAREEIGNACRFLEITTSSTDIDTVLKQTVITGRRRDEHAPLPHTIQSMWAELISRHERQRRDISANPQADCERLSLP